MFVRIFTFYELKLLTNNLIIVIYWTLVAIAM